MAAMTRFSGSTSPVARTRDGLVWTLVPGLAVAALVEFLVLRTFTRTAIHIPDLEALAKPYEVISFVGRYSYYVAALFLVLSLPALAVALWKVSTPVSRAAAVAVGGFAAAAGLAVAGAAGELLTDAATIVMVVLAGTAGAFALRGRASLVPVAFAVSFAASALHTTEQVAAQSGYGVVDVAWLLKVAEVAGVSFGVAAVLLASGTRSRKELVVAGIVAVVAFGLMAGGPSTRILLLWNGGLSGSLPAVCYAAAAGSLALAFGGLIRRGQREAALGLGLLLIGGIGLHSTYQSGLVIAGMALLCLAGPLNGREAATEPSAA